MMARYAKIALLDVNSQNLEEVQASLLSSVKEDDIQIVTATYDTTDEAQVHAAEILSQGPDRHHALTMTRLIPLSSLYHSFSDY